jgi:hypothetical protein
MLPASFKSRFEKSEGLQGQQSSNIGTTKYVMSGIGAQKLRNI